MTWQEYLASVSKTMNNGQAGSYDPSLDTAGAGSQYAGGWDEQSWNNAQSWFSDRMANIPANMRGEFQRQSKEMIPNWTSVMRATGMDEAELQALRAYERMQTGVQSGKYNEAMMFNTDFGGDIKAYTTNWQTERGENLTPDQIAEKSKVDDITGRIKAFTDSLGSPDPRIAAYLQRRASDIGQASAGRAGVSGRSGLSQLGTAGIAGQLDAQYAFQRQGLQAQGLGLMNQRDLGLAGLQQGYDQMAATQKEQQWAAQKNQSQGIGSAIGAGIAAIPGIALAGYTGGASLGLIGAGATIGGGIGGLAAGGGGPSYGQLPSFGTSGKKSGGLGNTGY